MTIRDSPAIRLDRVSLGYGQEVVLSRVSIDVFPGEFLPFVGPNGAGKTTLLKAILGLIRPMEGVVRTPFRAFPPGYVAQQKSIDPIYPVSIRQIVEMGAHPCRRAGMGKSEIHGRVEGVLEKFGLSDHSDKTFAQLSGGMRQKALIARALVSDPQVLIMDEPATELDEEAQLMVIEHLHRSAVEEGRTVLLAHHGLDALENRADKVCLVRDGKAKLVPTGKAHF